jgi:hypothetical protein
LTSQPLSRENPPVSAVRTFNVEVGLPTLNEARRLVIDPEAPPFF